MGSYLLRRLCRACPAVVAILVLSGLVVLSPRTGEAFGNLKDGSPAPEFTLKSTKGEDVSLAGYKGKAVVIAFVRQGQDKSEKALKALAALSAAVLEKTQLLAIVANPSEGDAAAWVVKVGVSFPVLLDPGEDVYAKYGARVAPATCVVKSDGILAAETTGYSASYKDEMEGLVKIALGLSTAEQVKAAEEKTKVPDTPEKRKMAERELDKARLLVARKMKDKALEPAKQAVASDDTYPAAQAFLGRLLLDLSDANADEALGHFQKALELAPKDVDAKMGLARVKALKGDYAGAVAMLEEAVRLNPKPERVYYQLGLVHEKAGKYEKAVEAYRKALEKLVSE